FTSLEYSNVVLEVMNFIFHHIVVMKLMFLLSGCLTQNNVNTNTGGKKENKNVDVVRFPVFCNSVMIKTDRTANGEVKSMSIQRILPMKYLAGSIDIGISIRPSSLSFCFL